MTEFIPFSCRLNLPYKEFIRFLNGGEYLDTFEVGSRTIDPISWPTQPRKKKTNICSKSDHLSDIVQEILERPWIDPKKFKLMGTDLKKKKEDHPKNGAEIGKRETKITAWEPTPADEAQVERILEDMLGSDLPPMLEDLDETCLIPEKMANKTAACTVNKKMSNKDDEIMFENSKRKLRQQYEQIENQKKRRRIQVIEFQKPQPPQAQAKKPPLRKHQSKRPPNQFLVQARKLHSVY